MRRHARRQGGQVIVLAALAIVVLIGILGLALDGGRAYVERRTMQGSVDAAALAAANYYMRTFDAAASEASGADLFATDELMYSGISCSTTSTSPLTLTCQYDSDPNLSVTIVDGDHGIAGQEFTATSTHRIPTTMMAVLGIPSMTIQATATAVARQHSSNGAAILTLSPDYCDSGGIGNSSLTFTGTENSFLLGDVWSNGSINVNSSGIRAYVAGNLVDVCPSIPPSVGGVVICTPDVNPTPGCPAYVAADEVNGWAQPDPAKKIWTAFNLNTGASVGYSVLLMPGTYAGDPKITGGCYFLAPGFYDWQAGFSMNGGFISNELRPPDEPAYGSYTTRASPQFWDAPGSGSSCGGVFQPYPDPTSDTSTPVAPGTYAVEITAARYDVSPTILSHGYPSPWPPPAVNEATGCSAVSGTCFLRESVPSMCKTVTIGSNQDLDVWTTNLPGAGFYNVYLSAVGATCADVPRPTLGYVASFANANRLTEQNAKTSGCEPALTTNAPPPALSSCDLGFSQQKLTSAAIPNGWNPATAAPPPDPGQAPVGAGMPNTPPAKGTFPRGDRANENYCATTRDVVISDPVLGDVSYSAGHQVPCPTSGFPSYAATPGAIEFYLPGGTSAATSACFGLGGNEDIYIFSGYQFHRVLVYEPGWLEPPANLCTGNNVEGGALTSLLGIFYMPTAQVQIAGNSGYTATISGGVIGWTVAIKGKGQVAITADPSLTLWPAAVRLTH